MTQGRSYLLSGMLQVVLQTILGLMISQTADAQLHQPALAPAGGGISHPQVYYPPQMQQQLAGPVSDAQTYYPPRTPQQMFQPAADVPAVPPAGTQMSPQVYAMRNASQPVYMPLPGGHSLSGQMVSPAPMDAQSPADPLPMNEYGGSYPTSQYPSTQYPATQSPLDIPAPAMYDCEMGYCDPQTGWTWTLLPKDLLWQSYVGGPREPRLASSIVNLKGTGWLWELEAGGRAGILRYGSGPGEPLEGWQLDLWGAAFPRLNFEENMEVDAVDFKVGVPLTWRQGALQFKLEWYHISSHLGDEFLLRPENAGYNRLDYLRDSIVLGVGYYLTPDWRIYGEADYAYNTNGGAEPWHFQFGVDYAPVCPTPILRPVPFFAVNANLREEVNYSGGINVVAGWQWRGHETQHTFRTGLHYYAGQSLQLSFLGDYEEFLGWGMWLDF